ncbi:hypothetical protein Back11_52930 [Paenibacillus baekrokdamisoli]|uniref:Uncharacterized protein n=1 Tax=Paenibacillus baekrokdamisoli TaxID=1712516 RepID=A0A3G9JIM8_9BACL|nr:hypothetical protein [Paenibacillus baekrokdamisoli]MBB3073323.1 hypothetical protein [Paenibacillus baekrokdamisoli]BBH23948.1 hypothetical protein Back11_52930 [Paenibacillus baekrokdamisoli]
MFLAEAAASTLSKFDPMDIFMLLFTVVIFIGWVRLLMARPKKNLFAIGFATVSLLVFLFANYVMIFKVWLA